MDWENLIKSVNGNVQLHPMYAPLKKISKQKLKLRNKLWITLGLQKLVFIKNHLLTKYKKIKVTLKTEYKQ